MRARDIYSLLQRALNEFDDVPVANTLRRALRIARLRGDADEAARLALDLRGIGGSTGAIAREAAELLAQQHQDPEGGAIESVVQFRQRITGEWMRDRSPALGKEDSRRSMCREGDVIASSAQELEDSVESFKREIDLAGDHHVARVQLNLRRSLDVQILNRIKHRAFMYLSGCEREMAFSATAADVFEQHRRHVERHLTKIAPDVLEKFVAVHQALDSGSPEGMSQAATSCRRVLQCLADQAYPPQDAKVPDRTGKLRGVGRDQFVNRLLMFYEGRVTRGTASRLMMATLEELGRRLSGLTNLASKGVHADVDVGEARIIVMHTYLVAGEVLELLAETKAE